jgi:hypothetical protein
VRRVELETFDADLERLAHMASVLPGAGPREPGPP